MAPHSFNTGKTSAFIDSFQHDLPSRADVVQSLHRAVPILAETMALHWGTGQGTRARHILWSLYTCSHLVNLGDVCSGLDARLANALSAAITARMILGPDIEPVIREILEESGEFARFDEVGKLTPDHLPVVYPPASADAPTLRKIADSLDHRNRRMDEN